MVLDDAPSVEVDIKDAGTSAPADVSAPVAEAPAAEAPSVEATTEPSSPDTLATPAEPSEARELSGNRDINELLLDANRRPDINNGQVGAAQQAQEERTEQRAERQEKDKEELEAAVDNAREASQGRRREAEEEKQRKEWEGKTHQMGNLEMSGADLDKLLQFMKSPAAIAKVEAAMKAKGASQKQIDKAQKEWKEYQELKEKEKSGEPLSPQEMKRLQEINKSQEFQMMTQEAVSFARSQGVQLDVKKVEGLSTVGANLEEADNGSFAKMREKLQNQEKTTVTPPVAASARSDFPSAVALTSVYNDTNAQQVAAAANLANNNNKPQQQTAMAPVIKADSASVQALM